jgi:hypothetical protein
MSDSATSGNEPASSSALWTDAELQAALEAYLYLLRLEQAGVRYSEREVTGILLRGGLRRRNDASIRYRLRNISFIMRDRGWPILSAYSPASQVGTRVKLRIEAMLDSHPTAALDSFRTGLQERLPPSSTAVSVERMRSATIARLEALEHALADLKSEFAGIGHNQPPEPIDVGELGPKDVQLAVDETRALKDELLRPAPDLQVVEEKKGSILGFGLKLATWIGERLTKFTDAALVTLASIAVAKATDVLPLIADTMGALVKLIQHLAH